MTLGTTVIFGPSKIETRFGLTVELSAVSRAQGLNVAAPAATRNG